MITQEVENRVADLYSQGKTVKEIKVDCNVSRRTIDRIVTKRGLKRRQGVKLITFEQIREAFPISRGPLLRIIYDLDLPTARLGIGGKHYYDANIIQRIKQTAKYKRAISHRNHKKYLRNHPEAYEADKHIMRCVTCQYLTPEFDPANRDYQCVNFRGGREIKNLPGRVKCGCWMWEWKEEEENDTERST